jgi:hypothetical protein
MMNLDHGRIMRRTVEMIGKLDGYFLRVFSADYDENLKEMP